MKKGVYLVLGTALISGFSIFFNAFAVKGIDSSLFTFSKNVIVAIFLVSLLFLTTKFREFKYLSKKSWLILVLIGFIGGGVPFLLFFRGLQLSTGPTAAFLHKTLFIYASIFAVIALKEKLRWYVLIPALLILLGNFLLLNIKQFNFGIGELLVLIAVLFWAIENIISKHVLKELSGTIVAFGRMFFGSLFILLFLLFTGKSELFLTVTTQQLGWILLTSVFLFGYVLTYYNGLKLVNVSVATSILLLGSPITLILDFFFLDKVMTALQLFGILLIIFGVASLVYLVEQRKAYETISTA